jgi:tyrosyl-tRNA synthetase
MNFCEEIKWRGLWHTASEGIEDHFSNNKVTAYIGFDPTASSLHIGSFLQIMLLVRLQRSGHTPIAIVGGGTGLIGDPSGRSTERQLLTKEATDDNLAGIRGQLERFLDFSSATNAARIVNNADWLVPTSTIDFMRDVGKHFTIGQKFGKTEGGPIWLDSQRTSPYRLYQFWYNTADTDVVRYLKYFTHLDRKEIDELERRVQDAPESRDAQRKLAEECTRMIHGESALAAAVQASQALFGGDVTSLPADDIAEIFAEVPSTTISRDRLATGIGLADLMTESSLVPSKGEARRLVDSGGFYLNNRRVTDLKLKVDLSHSIEGKFLVLRKGSKAYVLVKVS